jgi:hypothetical protein
VVEVEGVGFGRLEEIDDVAVLMGAFRQPVVAALLGGGERREEN